MCTVTLFPLDNSGFILTSNRDEAPKRKALQPEVYDSGEHTLWFPKDAESEGSWIGLSSKNRAVCLLNGAFEKHQRVLPYRHSRGVVVTHFLKCDYVEKELENYNLENIEPFTLVIADWNTEMKWFELVWDGKKRHVKQLPLRPHIWSSSTLYSQDMRTERKQWFSDFLGQEIFSTEAIQEFHHEAGKPNENYGVVMDRGFVKTTSITQIAKSNTEFQLSFEDLQEQSVNKQTLEFPLVLNE